MGQRFRGESYHKVDGKGRVSVPASFRRVIQSADPEWRDGVLPRLILVYGGKTRDYIEGFTINAMEEVEEKIARHPRGSARRKAMERLYSTQSLETVLDETGRIVLPARLREKIGVTGEAVFAATHDTFQIWAPEAYERAIERAAGEDEEFDPDVDPEIYLDAV